MSQTDSGPDRHAIATRDSTEWLPRGASTPKPENRDAAASDEIWTTVVTGPWGGSDSAAAPATDAAEEWLPSADGSAVQSTTVSMPAIKTEPRPKPGAAPSPRPHASVITVPPEQHTPPKRRRPRGLIVGIVLVALIVGAFELANQHGSNPAPAGTAAPRAADQAAAARRGERRAAVVKRQRAAARRAAARRRAAAKRRAAQKAAAAAPAGPSSTGTSSSSSGSSSSGSGSSGSGSSRSGSSPSTSKPSTPSRSSAPSAPSTPTPTPSPPGRGELSSQ